MRIGYDAKRFFHNTTGLGHYSRTLIQLLLRSYEDLEVVLFDGNPVLNELTQPICSAPQVSTVSLDYPGWYYRSINLDKSVHKANLDIYHGLSNALPLKKNLNVPYVVTIHDLLYRFFPNDFSLFDRTIYHIKTSQAIKNAEIIIAISEATKKSILDLFPVAEKKIKVIYQSYDPVFDTPVLPADLEAVLKKYKLPGNYNYYVGSVTYRKNLKVILEAMLRQSADQRLPLLIAGDGNNYLKEINTFIHQSKLSQLVFHLPHLPRSIVRMLYTHANAVIYPSLGEGFGLPVLEGIAANVPVITSVNSSMPEAGGDVAIYFNPDQPEELASILNSLNKESHLKQTAIKREKHLLKFHPRETAEKYYREIYQSLCKK